MTITILTGSRFRGNRHSWWSQCGGGLRHNSTNHWVGAIPGENHCIQDVSTLERPLECQTVVDRNCGANDCGVSEVTQPRTTRSSRRSRSSSVSTPQPQNVSRGSRTRRACGRDSEVADRRWIWTASCRSLTSADIDVTRLREITSSSGER
jgi:hypothetical protein